MNTRRSYFPVKSDSQCLYLKNIHTYWKEATTTAFKKYQTSGYYCEAVEALLVLLYSTKDIAELQDAELAAQQAFNHHVFFIHLNNWRGDGMNSKVILCSFYVTFSWIELGSY